MGSTCDVKIVSFPFKFDDMHVRVLRGTGEQDLQILQGQHEWPTSISVYGGQSCPRPSFCRSVLGSSEGVRGGSSGDGLGGAHVASLEGDIQFNY